MEATDRIDLSGKTLPEKLYPDETCGRTITYEVLITQEDYKSEQAREFVAFWNNGSLKQFITAFYKDEPASKDEIEELRNAIEELEE